MAADASDPDGPSDEREERLLAIVRAYTMAVENGEKPDRRAIMRRHPDLAAELSACLGGLTFLNNAAGQFAATAHDLGTLTAGGPQLLGDYRLLHEIGRGGMGVVYEAEQVSLGRRVAVKVLPMAAALDKRQLQRFRNEAQAAAQLHHTHIVPVYAVGCERSTHFYAMQLIDGQSLADVIADLKTSVEHPTLERSSVLSDSSAVSQPSAGLLNLRHAKRVNFYQSVACLGLQAAEALHHAHHAGIVHRDIKPANLLLDNEAGLWITDFGLAQFYAAENNLTQSSDRPGTLRYMSPEQAGGSAVVLDQRTDVYSLGVTLYELLTLERAVPGDTREQILHHLHNQDLRPARSVDAGIPKELETILTTACARDAADRYVTAGAFAEDLRRFLDDQPILAKPPPVTQRLWRWVRRHRAVAWSAVVTVLLLLAGLGVSTVLIAREQAKTRQAYFNERDRAAEAVRERLRAQRSLNEAREAVEYFANVAATELTDDRPSPEVRREMLETAVDYYETFLRDRRADPTQVKALADAQSQVARLLTELAPIEDAFRMRTLAALLNDPGVAGEVGLSPEQRARAAGLAGEVAGGRFGDEPPGETTAATLAIRRHDRMVRLGNQIRTALNAMLGPAQLDRLRQIARQVRGPAALYDTDVARMLGLSLEQKEKVRTIMANARRESRLAATQPKLGEASGSDDAAAESPRRRAMRETTLVLDPSQRVVWQSLIGKPYADAERLDPDLRRFARRRPPGAGPDGFPPPPHPDGPPPGWE